MSAPDPFDDFRAHETTIVRLRRQTAQSRTARETVGNTAGIGSAGLVLWLANLVGVDMPPDTAVFVGSVATVVVSSLLRKFLSRSPLVKSNPEAPPK